MAGTTTYWCEHAWLPDGVAAGVRVTVLDGLIAAMSRSDRALPGDEELSGLVLAGFANAHSHAFHRALRGRTQTVTGGSFWSWREQMYAVAARLDPDRYFALARASYAEMVLAGICVVAEFHYLHHQPGGRPYADPRAMSDALRAAAAEAGIRLTLLDTCYLRGGLTPAGPVALSPTQTRFSDQTVQAWAARHSTIPRDAASRVGVAVHSLRAVAPEDVAVVASFGADLLHVHLSEQPAENEACLAVYGRTPTELLAEAGALGPRTVAVHATHLTAADVALLGGSGTGVCLCPTTERDLADGLGPGQALAAAGSPLSVGSDSHAVVDLLEEARGVELHERLRTGVRGHFDPARLVGMLTDDGYAATGWPEGGSLRTGGLADLVAVSTSTPRTAGSRLDELVLVAGAADVTDVVVAGVRQVRAGRHRLGDVGAALARAVHAVAPGPTLGSEQPG